MRPRHASQYGRVLQAQGQRIPSRDSVWISESHLTAAFERYCYVSKQIRRKASNVPGPLESRRRLSKRQIAVLHAINNGRSLPAWALGNTVDMTKWKWEPPTSALERGQRNRHPGFGDWLSVSWLSALRNWIGQGRAHGATSEQTEPAAPEPSEHLPRPLKVLVTKSTIVSSFQEEIAHFYSFPDTTSAEAISSEYRHLCRKFQQYLYLGHIIESELLPLSMQLWDAWDLRRANYLVDIDLDICLYTSVIEGITTSSTINSVTVDTQFWQALLDRISMLQANDETYRLFEQLMRIIPPAKLMLVSNEILSVVKNFFSSWVSYSIDDTMVPAQLRAASNASEKLQLLLDSANSCIQTRTETSTAEAMVAQAKVAYLEFREAINVLEHATSYQWRIQTIATALEGVSSPKHGVLREATRFFQNQARDSKEAYQPGYHTWLSILAIMPLVNQEFLFEAIIKFLTIAKAYRMSASDICSLVLSQWESRRYLHFPERTRHVYQKICAGDDSKAFASLFTAIFQVQGYAYRGLFVSLCRLLGSMGRQLDIVNSFKTLGATEFIRLPILQEVALAGKNHLLAMKMHRLYKYHLYVARGPEWDPRVFRGYTKAMITDPTLNVSRIWECLDIQMFEQGPGTPGRVNDMARHMGSFGKERVAIVERLVIEISLAPHLRNRVAFRHVSQCVTFLLRHKRELSPPVLKAIYQVVSRDLVDDLPGRTQRWLWFFYLVSKHVRPDVSERCGVLFRRWRKMVKNKRDATE